MTTGTKYKFSVTKDDFEYQWFSGTGAGGQHRNRHQNCFRLKHKDTGIIKTGQSYKEAHRNKREALEAMAKDPRFLSFCDLKLREMETGETIEQWVEKQMDPKFIKVEVKNSEGLWTEEV